MDYSIKIGGEAGQGVQTIGDTLAKIFSRAGYHVFTHQDYESRIRGGHNFFQIRFSDVPILASRDNVDIIVALDRESTLHHERELSEDGFIIYDPDMIGGSSIPSSDKGDNDRSLEVPLTKLAMEYGGSKIMANTVATGTVLGMLRLGLDILNDIMRDTFKKKGDDVIKSNIRAAQSGYDFAMKQCPKCSFLVAPLSKPKMLISGIDAIAFGALAAGCKFYSAYPMTPSTGIMNYLAGKEKEYGIVVEQAEDEIAAINMALGASFAGVRSMTGTAGGGFALMVEGLSLAGMTEIPIVIALGQRPAPATGLPTRTEQGDLLFALYAAHGEFPRVIYAPGTPGQAFHLTIKAFDMAEKYQIPAFIIFDQYIADSEWTFEGFDLNKISNTDYRLRGNSFEKVDRYRRHEFTETGVSPLGIPGDSRHVVVTDSDEHDEEGHIVEDAQTRIKMVQKRLFKKMPFIKRDIEPPFLYGKNDPQILLTGWGSTFGVLKEIVDILSERLDTAMLHFSEMYPFPPIDELDYLSSLNNAKMSICIENNATGQFSRLIRAETGYEFRYKINKYDGRPFTLEGLLGEVNALIERL